MIQKLSLLQYVKSAKLVRCMWGSSIPYLVYWSLQTPSACAQRCAWPCKGHPSSGPSLLGILYYYFKVVYLLKCKSEAFSAFKQFTSWAENLTGQWMGSLRDDKGGEYMSREFEAICVKYGIQRQHTVQNRPQQNGVAERANRTIKEGVVSMLYESGMPTSFWGEAMASFIHVSNRVRTTSLQGSTPYEIFCGSKPDLTHMHVWGCTAYVLIQKDK